ncbi:hypothetical protein AXF06_00210 [Staphylococcus aureus]|nr:hypothetical protein [Staphylococcus aureus]MCL9702438.1 hypothetical protein [Staphylococcus aureus]
MLGPPPRQLPLFVEFLFEILCVGAPPTCTLLYAGFPSASVSGPTPTRIACRIWESNFSMLGPRNYCKKVVTIVFSFNQLLLI